MSQKRKEIRQEVIIVADKSESQNVPEMTIPTIQIPFESWWIQTQNRLNLKPDLQESVKKHFQARGFMDSKDFNGGLRDFGFKV